MASQRKVLATTERGALIDSLKFAATFAKKYARRLTAIDNAVQNAISTSKFINTPDRHPFHTEELHARIAAINMELTGIVTVLKEELDSVWEVIRQCDKYLAQCDGREQIEVAPAVAIKCNGEPTQKDLAKFSNTVAAMIEHRDTLQKLYSKYFVKDDNVESMPIVQMSLALRNTAGAELAPEPQTPFDLTGEIQKIMMKKAESQLKAGNVAGLQEPNAPTNTGEGGGCCGD